MIEQNIKENADKLILIGKEAWLKKRRSEHKAKMLDKQQEAEVAEIEKAKEQSGIDEQE